MTEENLTTITLTVGKKSKNLESMFLVFDLWTPELTSFNLKIGFSVKFPPRGLILRSQFGNLGQNIANLIFLKIHMENPIQKSGS